MFRRVISRGTILVASLLIAAFAYVQGYVDRDQGREMGFIPSALAAESPRPNLTPTQKLPDPNVYFPGSEELDPDDVDPDNPMRVL